MNVEAQTTWDESIRELVYESCLLLNEERWADYLALCHPEYFRYSIVNYSPEIRREQIWMDRSHEELRSLLSLLPRHNSDRSQLTRHATVYRVSPDGATGRVSAITQVAIYRTHLDGYNSPVTSGLTNLYAVGKYLDEIDCQGTTPKFLNRTVRLDTRQLDIGSHYLF